MNNRIDVKMNAYEYEWASHSNYVWIFPPPPFSLAEHTVRYVEQLNYAK